MNIFRYVAFLWVVFNLNSIEARCLDLNQITEGEDLKLLEAGFFEAKLYPKQSLTMIKVKDPYQGSEGDKVYVLSRNKINLCDKKINFIKLPIDKFVAMSTTHLSPLEILDLEDKLIGFGNTRFVYSKSFQKKVENKKIKEIGVPPSPEVLKSLNPDAFMVFAVSSPELEGIDRLSKLGLPIIYNSDYREVSPLARAEWIIFFGLLFERLELAKKSYQNIRKRYMELKKLARSQKKKPLIAIGKNSHGFWVAPGGSSDLAKMIQDAGGEYIWKDSNKREQQRIPFERAVVDFKRVDIWLAQNTWNNLTDALNEDLRYKKFKVVKNMKVFNNNNRMSIAGGNDYWEKGIMRPDLLLEDLIRIFHPSLLPEGKLRWYKKLKK